MTLFGSRTCTAFSLPPLGVSSIWLACRRTRSLPSVRLGVSNLNAQACYASDYHWSSCPVGCSFSSSTVHGAD